MAGSQDCADATFTLTNAAPQDPSFYQWREVLGENKLQQVDSLWKEFEMPEKANKVVKLKHFEKFQDTTEALAAATVKLGKCLKKVLKKVVAKEAHKQLAITDAEESLRRVCCD
ncbi:hypothetical protein QQF64_030952 [Cirrhinus molitorella]|uniref:Nucleolar protein 58/56 N-terminal domain-containing protein n=1 Tax=Cirrhinus molitorella TaxID=172907 RepID=A0ABR3N524_9TELE